MMDQTSMIGFVLYSVARGEYLHRVWANTGRYKREPVGWLHCLWTPVLSAAKVYVNPAIARKNAAILRRQTGRGMLVMSVEEAERLAEATTGAKPAPAEN